MMMVPIEILRLTLHCCANKCSRQKILSVRFQMNRLPVVENQLIPTGSLKGQKWKTVIDKYPAFCHWIINRKCRGNDQMAPFRQYCLDLQRNGLLPPRRQFDPISGKYIEFNYCRKTAVYYDTP